MNQRQWLARLGLVTGAVVALACNSDRLADAPDHGGDHPELTAVALRLQVDVEHGTVRVLPPGSTGGANRGEGPSFALLGSNEVGVTTGNLVRSAPVNNKVTVTFDAALTNRLTSASLIPSTFPGSTTSSGLLLFPFKVTQAAGGSASQVMASNDWNGDGTPGSGAPRNFFNDFGCTAGGLSDCYRWEQYPAPLGPGETTAAQKVGFTLPRNITSFTVLLVLAADIGNDLPAVAAIAVTPPSYVMNDGFPANFSAVAVDVRNNPMPWVTLTWTTADITALEFQYGSALVGVITGPSQVVHGRKVGPTSFTVSSGGVSVVVPVDIQVNTIVLVQPYIMPDSQLVVGEQVQAQASVKDNSGQIVPGFNPTWSTTDPNVATVDPATGLITAVGPGSCNIIATAAGAAGFIPITVTGAPTGSIAGTMRDLSGQPVKGANVHLLGSPGVDLNTTTADDGSYSFTDLPATGPAGGPAIYLVEWSPSGCVPGAINRIVLQVGGVVTVDIDVDCPPPTSGLFGQLRDFDGQGIAGATVEAQSQTNGQLFSTTTDAAGDYHITLLPDQYNVTFSQSAPCQPFTYTRTVTAGPPGLFYPSLDCPWHIQGKVTALGGLPLPLTVFLSSPTSAVEHASVLSDGTYEIVESSNPIGTSGAVSLDLFGLPTRCAVTGRPSNLTVTQQMQLTVADFTLDCRPPSIEVLVTDGGTNANPQPLIGMQVTLVGPSGASNSQTGTTGQNGVLFQTAEAGSNLISVAQGTHGCLGNSTVVTAQPGTQYTFTVPVSCSSTGALEGTLRTMLGNPLPNVNMVVGPYALVTDQQGHWGVAGLAPGPLFINVIGPMPPGCTSPGAFQAAVIPAFTITANATASCNGF